MGRPRTFDEPAVLEAAAREFRVHGFADTSTEQLCAATGVGRSSLYNTFLSKDELYVRTLEHYADVTSARQAELLNTPGASGSKRLQLLLDAIVTEEADAAGDGHAAGCMTVGALMNPDLRERDSRISAILDRDLALRLGMLEDTVRAGQTDGSLDGGVKPLDGAWLVVTAISGIRVSAQAGANPKLLNRIARASVSSLLA